MDPHQDAPPDFPDAQRAPGAGEVHVWHVALPAEEGREAARRALAAILAGYLGGAGRGATSADENGKPRLAEAPERLSFNLSHAGALALVAIAPGGVEVGVDVERLRPRRDLVRLAERWLPGGDATAVAEAAEGAPREAAFYAAWTRHEARVKCAGTGLAGPPPGPEIVARQLDIDPAYAAALAIDTATEPRLTWIEFAETAAMRR
ncbi:MAG TPA: 4'-phosphopantetheinyl transferase superfamily protein [Solirubrobacterales bacterium]|jgi:4'-phosphopantetheinyl transferase|nr:4'-phosphopantetheinyl transferase superfamily protein [Solirubrobacterales bacterium]